MKLCSLDNHSKIMVHRPIVVLQMLATHEKFKIISENNDHSSLRL